MARIVAMSGSFNRAGKNLLMHLTQICTHEQEGVLADASLEMSLGDPLVIAK